MTGWQILHLAGLILLPALYAVFRLAVPAEYPLLTGITSVLTVLGGAWGGMVLVAMVVLNNQEEANKTLWSKILAAYRGFLQRRIFLPIITCFLYAPIVVLAQNLIFYRTISVEVSGAGRAQIYRSPEPQVLESLGTTGGISGGCDGFDE